MTKTDKKNVTKNPNCYMKCFSKSEHIENRLWTTGKVKEERVFGKRRKNDSI